MDKNKVEAYKARLLRYAERQKLGQEIYGTGWSHSSILTRRNTNELGLLDVGPIFDQYVTEINDPKEKSERKQTAAKMLAIFLASGCSTKFALTAIHQAWFESRWNPEAINWKKIGGVNVPYAIGLFQFTRTGLGGPKPGFENGKIAGTKEQYLASPDKVYDATNTLTVVNRVIYAIDNGMKNAKVNNELLGDVVHAPMSEVYERFFWSPLAAGGRDAKIEALLNET